MTVRKIKKIVLLSALLLNLSACAGTQNSPNMMDYSYVPPASVNTVSPDWGIDDY